MQKNARQLVFSSVNLFLSVMGMALAVKLTMIHMALMRGEVTGGAACGAAGGLLDCRAVAVSHWAVFLGFPLAVWGILGYVAALLLSIISLQFKACREHALLALTVLATFCVAVDFYLLFILWHEVHRWCVLCFVTYAVNLALLVSTASALGKSPQECLKLLPETLGAFIPGPEKPVAWFFFGVMLVSVLGLGTLHLLFSQFNQRELRKQITAFVEKTPPVEVNIGDSPTKGAKDPALRVVEFSDFLCPACQKATRFNEVLLGAYSGSVSLTFKHFPLSADCNPGVQGNVHPQSCQVSEAAACVGEQGKFWEFHDRVYQKGPDYQTVDILRDVGILGLDPQKFESCLESGRGKDRVRGDAEEGKRLGIHQTPTYLLNGIYVEGTMTPPVFEAFFQAIQDKDRKNRKSQSQKT